MHRHVPLSLDLADLECQVLTPGQHLDDVPVDQIDSVSHSVDPEPIHEKAGVDRRQLATGIGLGSAGIRVNLDDETIGTHPLRRQRQRGNPAAFTRRVRGEDDHGQMAALLDHGHC